MRWVLAVIVAVLVVLVAFALSSGYPKNPIPCQCAQDSRKFTGIVEDCCCDYETVDSLNSAVLNPILQKLVKTPFFRYFKVKLWCDCLFWPDDGSIRGSQFWVSQHGCMWCSYRNGGQTVAYPLDVIRRRMQMVGWKDAASVVTSDGKAQLEYTYGESSVAKYEESPQC